MSISKNSNTILDVGFANNPMMIWVDTGTGTYPEGSTHRLLYIVLTFSSGKPYTFKREVDNGQTVDVDVSSAFRSQLHDEYMRDFSASSRSNSNVSATVKCHAEYMLDGEMITGAEVTFAFLGSNNLYGIPGGCSEMLRLGLDEPDPKAVIEGIGHFTVKPPSGEVINQGDNVFSTTYSSHRTSTSVSTASTLGVMEVDGGSRSVYVESNPNRHELYFLNQFCVFESASALSLESLTYPIDTNEKSIVNSPSFLPRATLLAVHSAPHGTLKLSSGFVTRDWADWWITEFLCARRHWIKLPSGTVVPVVVTPDGDTQTVYDRSKQELIAVNFSVKSALGGSLLV